MTSQTKDRRRSEFPRGLLVLIQALMIVLLIGLRYINSTSTEDSAESIYGLCVFFALMCAWSLWSWTMASGSFFDFYVLFFIASALFNGGQTFLEVLQLNEHGLLDGQFTPDVLVETLFVVMIGMAAMHLAALIVAMNCASGNEGKLGAEDSTPREPATQANLRKVGWAMLCISMPFALLSFKSFIGIVFSGGYIALYQQSFDYGVGAVPHLLAVFLAPGALFLLAGAGDSRSTRRFAVFVLLAYSMTQFFLGHRHEGAKTILALAWLWHWQVRPLNKFLTVGSAMLMVFVVFPLVQVTRQTTGSDRVSREHLIENFVSIDNPMVAAVHEMGGSMMITSYTIMLVPSVRDYDQGYSYWLAFSTLLPNLFWEVHPALPIGSPSDWLAWKIDPYTANKGGGLGYSFIAEAYLNFGFWGVPVLLFLGGLIYSRFVLWMQYGNNPARMALGASASLYILFLARAEMAVALRGVVWYAISLYLLATVVLPAWNAWTQRARPKLETASMGGVG